jgi:hypothetical protein
MRRLMIVTCIVLGMVGATAASAADRTSFGLGLGALTEGLGGNVALTSSHDMKFLALGCSEYGHSSREGTNLTCGIGVGWLRSDILTRRNDHHGLGLNLALDYDQASSDTEPVLRVPYVYFFNGIDQPGFNLGVAPFIRWQDHSTDVGAMIQIGYQF